jgi:hypothetical protein
MVRREGAGVSTADNDDADGFGDVGIGLHLGHALKTPATASA